MQASNKESQWCGRNLSLACLLAAGIFAAEGVFALAQEKSAPPSIILISVDTLRADRLSCYGYRGPATPHIDAMAQGGTLFSQVNAQVPLTLPSHVSLLTSTYPFANGIEDNSEQLGPHTVTLATALRARGYRTAAFVGGFVLDRRFGLNQGFDVYDSPFSLSRQAGKDPGDIKRLGEDVTAAAERWLGENSGRPSFVFLHLYDLHTPYQLPPAAWKSRGGSGYEAELGYVDEVLGNFWEFLSRRGLLEERLIVFTSDHGESLGEHGEDTHGYFIYESTLRVPLIIHWPARSPSFPARVDDPTSLLDVAPTLIQFVGAPRPAEFQGRSLPGLLHLGGQRPTIPNGPKGPKGPEEEIYSESLYAHRHLGTGSLRALRVGRYKYIEAARPELYDLTRDRGETQNLYGARRSLALEFRNRLGGLRSRFRLGQASGSPILSPEAIERLSSLGYVAVSSTRLASSDAGPDPKDRIADYEKYGRAIALASAGRLSEASRALRELLQLHPDLLDVRLTLGLNEQKLGHHAEAILNFNEVLKKDPLNVLAHFDLGVSDFALQHLDAGAKELRVALEIAPYYTRAEELLAIICLQRKDYSQAHAHFDHLITVDPENYAAHYNLGVLATLEGRWEDGERHLRAALVTDPSAAEAHNTLGSLYLRRGDLERAGEELRQAIRLEPKFAWAHYNLGMVFRQQKKDDEAGREFHQALDADPGFRAAQDALDRLRSSREGDR